MTEKRYNGMTNHYGTSRTYCTSIYDNQNNRELKNTSQVITELNALHEENQRFKQAFEQTMEDAFDRYMDSRIAEEVIDYIDILCTEKSISEWKEMMGLDKYEVILND